MKVQFRGYKLSRAPKKIAKVSTDKVVETLPAHLAPSREVEIITSHYRTEVIPAEF